MTPEQRERVVKWIAALRSGKYTQCTRVLQKADNSYCCLGVACEIYRQETGKGQWQQNVQYYLFLPVTHTPLHNTYWRSEVMETWFGVSSDVQEELIQRNDGLYNDFLEIADYLEQRYLLSDSREHLPLP